MLVQKVILSLGLVASMGQLTFWAAPARGAGAMTTYETLVAIAMSGALLPPPAPCVIGTGEFQLPVGLADGTKPFSVVTRAPTERLTRDFVPADLAPLDHKYESPYLIVARQLDVKTFWEQMRPQAAEHATAMMDAASAAGIPLFVHSAYRAYSVQCRVFNLKLRAEFTDPLTKLPILPQKTEPAAIADVNTRSALPGESEHQLGTAVDFVTNITIRNLGFQLEPEMDQMPAFAWLQSNAFKYGFVLSYPRGNVGPKEVNPRTGYVYEPWHWRYIGVATAGRYRNCESLGMTTQEFLRELNKNPKFSCLASGGS